jgi:hypothetical protein
MSYLPKAVTFKEELRIYRLKKVLLTLLLLDSEAETQYYWQTPSQAKGELNFFVL